MLNEAEGNDVARISFTSGRFLGRCHGGSRLFGHSHSLLQPASLPLCISIPKMTCPSTSR